MCRLPVFVEGEMPMRVAVVVAHPDDEVLGCGGTLARHAAAGDEVRIIWLAPYSGRKGIDRTRKAESIAALKELGLDAKCVWKWGVGVKDQKLDTVPISYLARAVEEAFREYQPETVYTHLPDDTNEDHRRVHAAMRPIIERIWKWPCIRMARAMEILSSSEITTKRSDWVDITWTIEQKVRAMACYNGESTGPRSPDVIRAQAILQGAYRGIAFAESFSLWNMRR